METIKSVSEWLSTGVEAAAALIIGLAVVEAVIRALLLYLRRGVDDSDGTHDEKEAVRLRLGRWLALALEFLLAADILDTAVAPTWDDIGKLAAIATLRTVLNFFLQREIDAAERRRHAEAAGARGG